MFYKKTTFPEVGEIALCTVKKILFHSVFVELDEYKALEGLIHISEISPGRIRNLRDFVREGKKIVCKVLKIDQKKGHVDLSLRRVSASMTKKKNEDYKQEQKAEKLLEQIGKQLGLSLEDVYKKIGYKLIEEYTSLSISFQEILQTGPEALKKICTDEKIASALYSVIKEKIKLPEVKISKMLLITNPSSDGIERIKSLLITAKELAKNKNYNFSIKYMGSPYYKLDLISDDYKKAENSLKEILDFIIAKTKETGGTAELKEK